MSALQIVLKEGSDDITAPAAEQHISRVVKAPTLAQAISQVGDCIHYESIHIVIHDAACFNPMDLAQLHLKKGEVTVETITADDTSSQSIQTAFLLAGLKPVSEKVTTTVVDDAIQKRILYTATTKKDIATAAVATAIPLRSRKNNNNTAAVTVNIDDGDDDELLINEDELLNEEGDDLAPHMNGVTTANGTAEDDCGGREPCDNCTCGRAAAASDPQPKTVVKTSSCGKCGLGDAFRCASCPYLGKPAFKPGEEHLVLELQDDF
jgi:hypothetical protein